MDIPVRFNIRSRVMSPLTITGGNKMKDFRPAKKRIEVSVGETVRILRELQELSQNQLSKFTGIPQASISAIENGRVNMGVERERFLPGR